MHSPAALPVVAVRVALGILFSWAGAVKLLHPAAFYVDLLGYRLPLPDGALRLTAILLPWLEVGCGGLLLANTWAETVRPLVAVLGALFVVLLGSAVLRGLNVNCGCFGPTPAGWAWLARPEVALGRAFILLGLAVWLWRRWLRPEGEKKY